MYCSNCGEKLNENWNYCPVCRNVLTKEENVQIKEKTIEEKKENSKEAIIYMILFFIGLIGSFTIKPLSEIFFILSLISIVTGAIKYPNNKVIKVFFWIFIICIIILIAIVVISFFTCVHAITSCPIK